MTFEFQHAFVTGVSSGLGKALADLLLTRGGSVVGTVRNPDDARTFEASAPGRAHASNFDLRQSSQAEGVVAGAFDRLGRIDLVVLNAGIGFMGAFEELTDAQIRDQFEVNLFGTMALVRAVLPHIRRQARGRLVFISSVAGLIGEPMGFGVYNAPKHALEGWVETLAKEVSPFGIGVHLIEPGPFHTEFGTGSLQSVPAMPEYETSVGKTRRFIADEFNKIASDPADGARVILDAVALDEPPLRLLLGRNALAAARKQLTGMLSEFDRWAELSESVDAFHPAAMETAP